MIRPRCIFSSENISATLLWASLTSSGGFFLTMNTFLKGGLLVWAFLSHCTAKFKTGKFDYSFRHSSFFFFYSCIRRESGRLVGGGAGEVAELHSLQAVSCTFQRFLAVSHPETNCLYKLSCLQPTESFQQPYGRWEDLENLADIGRTSKAFTERFTKQRGSAPGH